MQHNWIITGSFVVEGITGYIYIKQMLFKKKTSNFSYIKGN